MAETPLNDVSALVPKILAQGVMALREYCVMPRLVNSDYSNDAREKGDTVDIPIPSAIAVTDVEPANVAPNPAAVSPTKAQIPLNYWREAAFTLNDKNMADAMDGIRPMQVSEAVRAIANDINTKLFGLYKGIYGFVGTGGTTPFGSGVETASATNARKTLNKQLAPLENRRMVLDPDAEAQALNLRAFQDASFRADADGIIEGQIGRKFGFNFFSDQQVPTHTTGTLSNGSIHAALVDGIVAAGAKTVDIDETTLTGTVVTGDIFTVANVAGSFTVTNTSTLTASGNAITGITFEPAAPTGGFADDAVITFKPTHVVNLGFHRDAFGFASRPLLDQVITEGDRQSLMSIVDPVSQVAIRLEVRREHKRTRWSFDVLYGVGIVRREFAVRLAG